MGDAYRCPSCGETWDNESARRGDGRCLSCDPCPVPDGGRRVHFMTDVTEHHDGWECERCGRRAASKELMHEHRRGLLSRCYRSRAGAMLRGLLSGGWDR